ncbi:MAG: hypothetical protein JXR70_10865 [Spirochaetales bacterium]|nr:hypothetical protein [Spirochaetales bacterium]
MEVKLNEVIKRIPLFKEPWKKTLEKLGQSPYAPAWNSYCGDQITDEYKAFVDEFEKNLYLKRFPFNTELPDQFIGYLLALKPRSLWFYEALENKNWIKEFHTVKTMDRGDLQKELKKLIPFDEKLDDLIINPTSGTTGQPVKVPNHPKAIGCYDPLILFALHQHGIYWRTQSPDTAAIQICNQQNTITYFTAHSFYNGSGFAKINLNNRQWQRESDRDKYLAEADPYILSGDPYSFYSYLNQGIHFHPKTLLSTSISLSKIEITKLMEEFQAPVINIYSLNETGPIGYSCPLEPDTFHILPHDIFVEILDDNNRSVEPGKIGNIHITGGRNPYLPLLRYKTGDQGWMDYSSCDCGDKMPKLHLYNARKMVIFKNLKGQWINPVDVPRILKDYPIIKFHMTQDSNLDCELSIKTQYPLGNAASEILYKKLTSLFDDKINLTILEKEEIESNQPFESEIDFTFLAELAY